MSDMTNEQILEQQVEALEKLLQLRKAITEELEAKISRLEAERFNVGSGWNTAPWITTTPWVGSSYPQGIVGGIQGGATTLTSACPDGSPHHYSSGITGVGGCSKCGQSMTITAVTTGGAVYVPNVGIDGTTVGQSNVLTLTNVVK